MWSFMKQVQLPYFVLILMYTKNFILNEVLVVVVSLNKNKREMLWILSFNIVFNIHSFVEEN